MYLFCVQVDLVLEQTAGLIGWETKGSYLSAATWLRQMPVFPLPPLPPGQCLQSLSGMHKGSGHPSPPRQKMVILHHDYPTLAHGFFYLVLQSEKWQDQISSHHLSPSYLPPLGWFLNGKNLQSVLSSSGYSAHLESRSTAVHRSWMSKHNISLLVTWFLMHNGYNIFFFLALINLITGWLNLFLIHCLHSTTSLIYIVYGLAALNCLILQSILERCLSGATYRVTLPHLVPLLFLAAPLYRKARDKTKGGLSLVIRMKRAQTDRSSFVSYHLSPQLHCVGSHVITEDQGQALRKRLWRKN